eukprot:262288-Pelagomonas_calceolata.AAC.4
MGLMGASTTSLKIMSHPIPVSECQTHLKKYFVQGCKMEASLQGHTAEASSQEYPMEAGSHRTFLLLEIRM